MYDDYFPRGIAKGKAFCNRVKEKSRLQQNLNACRHTIIISPRRYGKSSLANKIMRDSGLIYEKIDFFVAADGKGIESHIVNGVNFLINMIMNIPEQTLRVVKNYFKNLTLKPILEIGTKGVILKVSAESRNVASNILDLLRLLDKMAAKKKIKLILFFDEFQQISKIAKGLAIEGAIRNVAQETDHLVFIFSGSDRILLASMFEDSNRPLYKLCDRINLDRISSTDYEKFLNKVAKKAWNLSLSTELLNEICALTERHPYYMNILCAKLWQNTEPPTIAYIKACWQECVYEEKGTTAVELQALSPAQRTILKEIAKGKTDGLTSKDFLSKMHLSGSTVIKALSILEKKGYISKTDTSRYTIIDPLIKWSLIMFA
jgi:AAA+ ATPase superfamily predicted ATPase